MSTLTLAEFAALIEQGLEVEVTYNFVGRYTANMSADLVRQRTQFVVLWVGPQQFEVR